MDRSGAEKRERRSQYLGSGILLLAALIWGCAFVAQSVGMDHVGPFTFNGVRLLIGALTLTPIALFRHFRHGRAGVRPSRRLIAGGMLCGLALMAATSLQQIGLLYTTPGKAGFLTALYIIEVPLFGIFLKRRISPVLWVSIALALCGMYLLCLSDGLVFALGDLLILLCSLVFALHITLVDRLASDIDGITLSCIQFWVAGLLSLPPMLLFERPTLSALSGAALPLLYAGVLSCGVAYTLQIVGQKRVRPTLASMLMSFESVFSLLAGVFLLGELPTLREGFGCLLMFAAVLLAQTPPYFSFMKKKSRQKKTG